MFRDSLVSLPFLGFLTTNYDRLLERALGPFDGDRAVDAQTDAPLIVSRGVRAIAEPGRSETVIHLHGTGHRPEGMVLTVEDYKQAYGLAESAVGAGRQIRRPHARNLLSALLMTRRVVFVGFGLRDPFLMRVLRDVTADWWEWDSPIHYAIMPIDEVNASDQWKSAAKYRREYGIEILFYEVRNDDHGGLVSTLEEIAGRIGLLQAAPADQGVAPEAQAEEPKRLPPAEIEYAETGADFEALMRERIRRNLRGVEEDEHED